MSKKTPKLNQEQSSSKNKSIKKTQKKREKLREEGNAIISFHDFLKWRSK